MRSIRKFERGLLLAFNLLLLPVCAAAQTSPDAWTTYVNVRFGTAADVPASGFRANPPPANGDGRSWKSADGRGAIAVFGSFMAVADSVAGYRQFMLTSAREGGVNVTYNTGRDNWFVYSGLKGGSIVYVKVVVTRPCGTYVANHIHLEYPADQQPYYGPIVKRMSASLRGSSGAPCP